jgi:hypothetical protein
LFRFYTKTENFDASIELKQTEEQPKQCDREHILVFFQQIQGCLGLFRFVFGLFRNSLFRFYTETDSFDVWIELKLTEHQPKQFDREHILVFFRKFRVVSVCFETVLFVSVVSILVQNTETSPNKPKFLVFGFTKQTKTKLKQIFFWFVSVRTETN